MDGRHDKSDGCPEWVPESAGVMALKPGSRELEPVSGCGKALLRDLVRDLARATYGHAAAAESGRNEVVNRLAIIQGEIPTALRDALPGAMLGALRGVLLEQMVEATAPLLPEVTVVNVTPGGD